MRLREVQKIIEDNLPHLYNVDFEYVSGSGYKTTKYSDVFLSVINLEKLGFIDAQYNDLIQKNLLVNSSKSDSVLFSQENRDIYTRNINQIIYKSEACLELIKQNLHSEKENEKSLVISLPNRDLSFNEFNEIVETLNETLRLLAIIPEFQSEIKLSNFDVGTEWLVLSFLTDRAVKIFGRLTTTVQRTQVGIRQNKALDAHLETLELDAKILSDFKEATAKANAKINEDLAKRFLEEENLDNSAEILSQMSKVIENTDKLMNIGVGFTSAITASNEVANTFPPLIDQKKLDKVKALETIRQIEEKTDKTTSTENDNEKED